MNTILGIDIGTSSVKCSIVRILENEAYEIVSHSKCSYDQARIQNAFQPGYSQQNVREILLCLDSALKSLPQLYTIERIALSCQMHGIVLWNTEQLLQNPTQLNYDAISDLYDWTDLRCTPDFLSTLPPPDCYADVPSSGYGCVTLFWLNRFQPEMLQKFNASSTIGDFVGSLLCSNNKSFISTHNAHSWAYFDPFTFSWNKELLENNDFPVHLLPEVLSPGTIIGSSSDKVFKQIPNGKEISVCIGDLQAIMFCALHEVPEASYILNMGTSAQLCRIEKQNKLSRKSQDPSIQVDFDPFYDGSFIVKAASLNGGNVLQSYVNFLKDIIESITGIQISSDKVWSKLGNIMTQTKDDTKQTIVELQPTLYGERHSTESALTLSIRHRFPSLFEMTTKLSEQLIENLVRMMASSVNKPEQSYTDACIVCTGSVLSNTVFMKAVLQKRFPNTRFISQCDAEVGAALFSFMFAKRTLL